MWEKIAKEYAYVGTQLQYQQEEGAARPLLHTFLDPELRTLPGRHLGRVGDGTRVRTPGIGTGRSPAAPPARQGFVLSESDPGHTQ